MKNCILISVFVLTLFACGKNNQVGPAIATPNYQPEQYTNNRYCCVRYSSGYCGYTSQRQGEYSLITINGYMYSFNNNMLSCY